MEVNEFAKFVLDNLTRATIGNTLNISNKLDCSDYYKFTDFLEEIQKYTEKLLLDGFDKNKCYEILVLVNKTLKKYKSEVKYNKTYIINDFVINLWRIMNGH